MEIRTIAVIGAASMGRTIAYAALAAGYRTILEDVLPERLASAVAEIRSRFEDAVSGGKIRQANAGALARLSTAASVDVACREADLVMEALPDEAEMKIDVFCILEKFARPGAILATNAQAIAVSEIAAVTSRGEECVGLQFRESAAGKRLLEIVRGRETSEETVAACRELGRRLGREVVITCEPAGRTGGGVRT